MARLVWPLEVNGAQRFWLQDDRLFALAREHEAMILPFLVAMDPTEVFVEFPVALTRGIARTFA